MDEFETSEMISQRERAETQAEENCMSKEEFEKLDEGDTVVVRDFDDLTRDYGNPIYGIPCGWNEQMDECCGTTLQVRRKDGNCISAYGMMWSWSRQMLKPNSSKQRISDSEMQDLWSQMILGEEKSHEER